MGLGTIAEGFSPSEEGRPSIDSLIKESVKTLNRLSRFIPSLETLSSRLESSRLEIDDIIDEIVRTDSEIELSESRLQMVSERISFLYSLMKKHSCSTVGELIELRDSLSDKLFDSASLEERIASLEAEIALEEKKYDSIAKDLDTSRRRSAGGFAEAVGDSLEFLELEKAVFLVEVSDAPEGPSGRNSVTFMFSSTGKAPLELSKCASGGEMSRIMLSLKAMLARYTDMPSLVFDEIDSGVSGSAADKMGSMICRMGENMQVFAITHLPQVAAKGNAHYLVSKAGDVSSISRIDGEERVMEIARMLSGSSISEAAIQNAKTLLG
jgi:DNA repair protein RecN (Recombination protein N)